ncbi:SDR family NAD(P)-dependent oxidoreductase [Trinickia sp.]|uniref:SDR family NAD(P)-dependent oxidoreductase n=1 Tax=Trinickia sp. TaxID=2571163 RepID=UPI003F7D4EFC
MPAQIAPRADAPASPTPSISHEYMSKSAIVTGAASGIGRRAVERLLLEGWSVIGLDLADAALAERDELAECRARYTSFTCDIGIGADVHDVFQKIAARMPKLDALICSAGVVRFGALENHESEELDLMFSVNVKGPWACIRSALPLLRNGSSPHDPARVVVIGSIGGIRPKVGSGFYSVTKAAVHVLASVFAVELAPSGVTVNVVAPGTIETPMTQGPRSRDDGSYNRSAMSPLGRIGRPDDVADAVLYLLGDGAKYVNGVVLPVDGGSRAAFTKT